MHDIASEYSTYDGLGLAELVRTHQVSPLELVEAAISQIERYNPALNAVVTRMDEQARHSARQALPDGPFKGVPMLLKDLWDTYAGVPTSNGNRLQKAIPAAYDSEMVRRFKASGAVIVGKTNIPEFGCQPITEPDTFGPTRNPWNLERTSGGSSGGSAAAVAAGMVPIASATDGGGSIRIPASCCGIVGLKVSRGRTPNGPDEAEMWRGLGVEHIVSRSVRDSAAMLDATAGLDPGAPYAAPLPERPFLEEVSRSPGQLRIAFTDIPFFGGSVHPDCRRGLHETVRLLEDLGHTLVDDHPLIDREAVGRAFLLMVAGEVNADLAATAKMSGRRLRFNDADLVTWGMDLIARNANAGDYTQATHLLGQTARDAGRFFQRYDVLLTPTLGRPPVPVGFFDPNAFERPVMEFLVRLNAHWLLPLLGIVDTLAARAYSFMAYTPLFNITGQPAISLPLHWNAEGLPIGMHFAARYGDEATLLRLAGQLEQARPWVNQRPPLDRIK